MKLLHTSDWHVGKTLRGRSRIEEQEAVLAEIAGIARREAADVVVVAGDLFDTAAPTAEAERVVYRALLDLASTGATVAVIAGNHDNERRLQAVQPLLELGSVVTRAVATDGVVTVDTRSGERAALALLPWIPKHHVERVEHVMSLDPAELQQHYAERIKRIVERLAAQIPPDAVGVMAAHLALPVSDQSEAGEEVRQAHLFDYAVPATVFPATLSYVALGHYHRAIDPGGACPIRYCGAPMWLGFPRMEHERDDKGVFVVEAAAGHPAIVRFEPVTAGRRLRTLRGSLDELEQLAGTTGDDYLRIYVRDQARAGIAQQVREWFPEAVDVHVDTGLDIAAEERAERSGRSPKDLFRDYLAEKNATDERVVALFDQLLEEVYAPDPA